MKWESVALENIASIKGGKRLPKSHSFADSITNHLYIRARDIKDGEISISEPVYITEDTASTIDGYTVSTEDIVITIVGANIGDIAYISEKYNGANLTENAARVRVKKDKLNAKFLALQLSTSFSKEKFQFLASGSAQGKLGLYKIKLFDVVCPPLSVQNKIADILSRYDEAIANNRRRIELLERSSRLLYREWFVHLRYPGHEHGAIDLDGIPEGWERKKISTLGEIITGKTPSKKKESNFGGNIPFVKTPDMHDKIVVLKTQENLSEEGANSQSTKYLPRGSIMVSCIGTVGVVSMVAIPCQTNQQINSIIFDNPSLSYFGFFALKDLKPKLEAIGGGATMANVNKQKFGSLEILVPPKQFLILFQQNSESIFKKIENLYLQNQKLQSARDLLLPRLMNGEINV